MTPDIRPLVAGNWKMNGLTRALNELETMRDGVSPREMGNGAKGNGEKGNYDTLICVPFTLLAKASEVASRSSLKIGAQDCHKALTGAHTGDISVEMIADCGAQGVIVGHSERRTDHGETSDRVREKAQAALNWGHLTIVCIGESEEERKSGATLDVLGAQMAQSIPDEAGNGELVVAYEPIWAIGTGLTPTPSDVEEAHKFMREELCRRFGEAGKSIRLLYGGSVKPGNAAQLMAIDNVDGALIGGASLKAEDFLGICAAYH